MSIKVLILKSGEDVIADVQEMRMENESIIGYFLSKPCVVKLQTAGPLTSDEVDPAQPEKKSELIISMYPWMPLAREKTIPIPSDWVVTIVTPVEKVLELYEKEVLKNEPETNKDTIVDEQSDSDI